MRLNHPMAVNYNILDLGKSDYNDAWELQKKLQSQRISGQIDDQLLLVEHFPVYTLGKNTPREHLLTKESDNISIIQTDRGGDITFHGPGQLVGYPILDLNQYKRSITWYMRELEQLIIDVLKEYDISAERKKGLTGTWVKDKKIAALGVRISKWVTMHGFSLNINPDLKYYKGIIPCGITDYGVTSMSDLLGNDVPDMSEIKETLVQHFIAKFSVYKN
jgi:lipoate-protein ligase B